MDYSRRQIGKMAIGAMPAAALLLGERVSLDASPMLQTARPNSLWGGVQVGIIAPYAYQGMATTVEDILRRTVELGLSAVELQSAPVEAYAGLPPAEGAQGRGAGAGRATGPSPAAAATAANAGPSAQTPAAAPAGRAARGAPTPQDIAAQQAREAVVRKWRLSQSLDKYKALRAMYEKAGVAIQIVKFNVGDNWTDEELDYAFQSAKALGSRAITCEPALSQTKRLGLFADKHQIMLGYHGHADVTNVEAFGRPGAWEQAFFYSKFNGANLDIGHFTAGNSKSPIPFIREHHARITNLHLKDRGMNNGPNVPWGEGDTPIIEVLQLMKRERYPFMATIELEYRVDGSDAMAELKKCVEYCRQALV